MEVAALEEMVKANPEAVALVKGLSERASKFTPDLEKEIGNLETYKQSHDGLSKILAGTKAESADKLLTDFANLKQSNTELLAKKDSWKNSGDKVDKSEYLALEERIKASDQALQEIKDKLTASEKKEADAVVSKRETDLKASIVSQAGKMKATDPEDIFILLKNRGYAGFKEDGTPFYNKMNEAGQMVAVSGPEEMVKVFLDKRKDLVSASGTPGVGGRHGGGDGGDAGPTTREQAHNRFLGSRGKQA
jgi:hypothetical protein